MFSSLKLYGLIAAALALAGAAFYVHRLQGKASRVDAAESALADERRTHAADIALAKHNEQIARETSNAYQIDLRRLESERSNVPVVRLCKSPLPKAAPSSAASGPDPASAGHLSEEASPDIGPALLEYGIACEANAMQLDRLIDWVKAR